MAWGRGGKPASIKCEGQLTVSVGEGGGGGLDFAKTAHFARISVAPGLAVQAVWKGLGTGWGQSWRCCVYLLGVQEAVSMLGWHAEMTSS